mmetsp:Transcript_29322/g.59983  ORF Transcript_29322/g.59983 Transcript_29322/m.59983 type:complete len:472 (+) Transcript_29322:34-1449(+)
MRYMAALTRLLGLSIVRSAGSFSFAHSKRILTTLKCPCSMNAERTTSTTRPPNIPQRTGGLRNLPTVTPANELSSRARKKVLYLKPDSSVKNARLRERKHSAVKITALTNELSVPLRTVVEGFRKQIRRLHPYEAVVADLTVRALEKRGKTTLDTVLAQIKEVHKEVNFVGKAAAAAAKQADTAADAIALGETGLEATAEVVERPETVKLMLEMVEIAKALRGVPVIELDVPTVVLVGAPNVGKSSLIRAISTGTPEVNDYPFTTRGVTLGHMYGVQGGKSGEASSIGSFGASEAQRYQVMDSPGVLARPDEDRNEMESLTIASLLHIPTAVVFVADLSGLSGDAKSSVEDQCAVRRELRARFPRRPWLDVVSKADIDKAPEAYALFLAAVREGEGEQNEADAAPTEDQREPFVFGAGGTADEVMDVSVFSGEGVDELAQRLIFMLEQVDKVLRAYEVSQMSVLETDEIGV